MSDLYPETLRIALTEERLRVGVLSAPAAVDGLQERIAHRVQTGIGPSVFVSRFSPTLVAGLSGTLIGVLIGVAIGAAVWSGAPPRIVVAEGFAAPVLSDTRPVRAPTDEGEGAAAAPADVVVDPPAPVAPIARPATNTARPVDAPSVGDELRLFERAEAAAAESRYVTAEAAYRRYIDRYPHGTLVTEARMGVATLRLRAGDARGAKQVLQAIAPSARGPGLARQVERLRTRIERALSDERAP